MTEEYDFVIVGGGTSGLVVATRLSEDPNISVLVVEAGGDHCEDPRAKTPALHHSLKKTEADWDFRTEPQTQLNGRQIHLSQGRALGGSSTINATVFVPPSRTIIDSWETLGNPGWNWETMMPYYTKSYSLAVPEGELARHLGIEWAAHSHARSGPIQASYPGHLNDPIPKAWIETFKSLGYDMKEDPFSGAPTGAFASLLSVDPAKKERSNAATAYYRPVAGRKNLRLLTGWLVEKILFDQDGDKIVASGVRFQQGGEIKVASARKEVILAAGAIQSPKMLELSGIGNSKLLKSHGIKILVDNPNVGENLQDHIFCNLSFEAKENIQTLDDLVRKDPKAIEVAMTEYKKSQSGLFASVGVASFAYLPVAEFLSEEGQMKLKKLLDSYILNENSPAAKGNFAVARRILENEHEASGTFLSLATQSDVLDQPMGPLPGKFVTISAMLSQPLSTGSVHIVSSSPLDKPILDPNYLSNPIDLEILARHVLYVNTIVTSEPFKSTILKEGGRRKGEDAYFQDLQGAKKCVKRRGVSMWHPTSTCAMLPKDEGGVVDDRLRVWGTKNLRVVDASIMPIIPRANIQSSVYAVAERAADIIKADHRLVGK